jgi:hypothetical protein
MKFGRKEREMAKVILSRKKLLGFATILAAVALVSGSRPAQAVEIQTSPYCLRDLLKTILVNDHRTNELVRPLRAHVLKTARAYKGVTLDEQVDYLVQYVQGLNEADARAILKIVSEYPNRPANARVVFGGSRVRGTSRPESDLDLGFFGFGRNQVDKIIKKINSRNEQGVFSIPVETTKIYETNETPFIPRIQSPEEFFMRSGAGWSSSGKMKDFTPSGFISIGMDGTILHVPPPGSLAAKVTDSGAAETTAFLQDLDQSSVWPSDYRAQFLAKNNREPTSSEWLAYQESKISLYEEAVPVIAGRLKARDPALAAEFETYFQDLVREVKRKHLKPGGAVEAGLEKTSVRLSGMLGEMRAVLSLDHVKEIGRRLHRSEILGERLRAGLGDTAAKVTANPSELEALSRKYPAIFPVTDIKLLAQDPAQLDAYLKRAKSFIESKQADLLVEEAPGQYAWIEVKNNRAPLSMTGFQEAPFGKSAAAQVEENLQIIEYLGLKDQVKMKLFVNGMEPELVRDLESKGVGVLFSTPRK